MKVTMTSLGKSELLVSATVRWLMRGTHSTLASDQSMGTLQLQTRLSNRSWVRSASYSVQHSLNEFQRDEDSDGEDPFADVSCV